MKHKLFNKFSARKHSSRIGNFFREEGIAHSCLCLLYFVTKTFLFTLGQNESTSLIKYSMIHHVDAMGTACFCIYFQTIKYPMPIFCIFDFAHWQWWQIIFKILNLWHDMATAALHFSLRTTSLFSFENYL